MTGTTPVAASWIAYSATLIVGWQMFGWDYPQLLIAQVADAIVVIFLAEMAAMKVRAPAPDDDPDARPHVGLQGGGLGIEGYIPGLAAGAAFALVVWSLETDAPISTTHAFGAAIAALAYSTISEHRWHAELPPKPEGVIWTRLHALRRRAIRRAAPLPLLIVLAGLLAFGVGSKEMITTAAVGIVVAVQGVVLALEETDPV